VFVNYLPSARSLPFPLAAVGDVTARAERTKIIKSFDGCTE